MDRRIIIATQARQELREAFGVTDKAISEALNYRSHSDQARKIRVAAIRKGGLVAGVPDMETLHTADRKMVQTWGDRAKIVADLKTGAVQVYFDGKLDREYPEMSIPALMREQRRIALLVATR